MKKSTLIMILSLVLAVALGVGGTLAYLQDTDEDVNVMTLGSVYITQNEQERDADGNLVPFTPNKPAYPAVGPIAWADKGVVVNDTEYKVFTDELQNVVDKIVTVTNTGKSDAYIRTIIAIEAPDYDPADLIHFNFNETDVTMSAPVCFTRDDVDYVCFCFTYADELAPQETSAPSLMQLFLDSKATNADVEKFGETWEVLVLSQAVQTQGFADANTALNTAFEEVNAENVAKWFGADFGKNIGTPGDKNDTNNPPVFPVNASDADEMMAGLVNGTDIIADKDLNGELIYESDAAIELDAKGATVVLNGSAETNKWSYFGFVPPAGEDVAVSNLNVTGAGFVEVGHYGQGGGDYTIDNMEIKNFSATMAVVDGANKVAPAFCHYGTATLNDCTMTGTTTEAEGATAFDAGFVNGTTTYINGGEYGKIYLWSQAHVTIKDAEVDVINSAAITTRDLGMLTIGAGAHVGTINLIPVGTYPPALTIEEGATVDAIVYQGVTYTQAEWLAR